VKRLRQAQDRLIRTERLGALRSLTSGIAHEMNTPAGVLITATSYLESELEVVDALVDQGNLTRTSLNLFLKATRDTTEILQRNLLRLNRLIEEFRSVSVTEHLELSPRPFFLEQTIEMAAQRSGYASTGHRIDLQLPKGLELRSYESAFEELFRQLFLNTLQHGFTNKRTGEGLVTITGFIQEPHFYLTFQDNGDGLIEGVRPRIFDPFYTTKRIEGATGLGMYILFNLVREVLHGDVSCEPSDGFLLICSFETDQLFGKDSDVHPIL
jgi:signal transduction histidine kinase